MTAIKTPKIARQRPALNRAGALALIQEGLVAAEREQNDGARLAYKEAYHIVRGMPSDIGIPIMVALCKRILENAYGASDVRQTANYQQAMRDALGFFRATLGVPRQS